MLDRQASSESTDTANQGIEVLTKFSFHSTSPSTSKTALQCLVNALLSKTATRQMFVNLGYSARAVVRLKVREDLRKGMAWYCAVLTMRA